MLGAVLFALQGMAALLHTGQPTSPVHVHMHSFVSQVSVALRAEACKAGTKRVFSFVLLLLPAAGIVMSTCVMCALHSPSCFCPAQLIIICIGLYVQAIPCTAKQLQQCCRQGRDTRLATNPATLALLLAWTADSASSCKLSKFLQTQQVPASSTLQRQRLCVLRNLTYVHLDAAPHQATRCHVTIRSLAAAC
jgi:hypothetical protein